MANEIGRVRVLFKYAFDIELIDRPVRYGASFKKPSRRALRKVRNDRGDRTFTSDELRTLIEAASPVMKAMLLLGANCAFGQTDVASLPISGIDFDGGWVEFPRPKTEIPRRIPLWPETIAALQVARELRPKPKDETDSDLLFLTKYGNRWVRTSKSDDDRKRGSSIDPLSQMFRKLMKTADINGHRGFYSLRHGFETVGGESRDQVAVNSLMGHVDSSMAATYRHGVSDERLRAVVDVVRDWLWQAKTTVRIDSVKTFEDT